MYRFKDAKCGDYLTLGSDGSFDYTDELEWAFVVSGEDNTQCFVRFLTLMGHRVTPEHV